MCWRCVGGCGGGSVKGLGFRVGVLFRAIYNHTTSIIQLLLSGGQY